MCYGEIISDRMVRARKEHRCAFCKHPIRAGQEYTSRVIADEGTVHNQRSHARCEAALKEFRIADQDGCIYDHRTLLREGARGSGWKLALAAIRGAIKR